jgi:hypothetical protein
VSDAPAGRQGDGAALGVGGYVATLAPAEWLGLAATPTFAIFALAAAIHDTGSVGVLCSAAGEASPLSGMIPMYLLMSAFHSTHWLKLISSRPSGAAPKLDR